MEQPGGQTPKTPLASRITLWALFGLLISIPAGMLLYGSYTVLGRFGHGYWLIVAGFAALLFIVAEVAYDAGEKARIPLDEAQARQRVRRAEDRLAESLRENSSAELQQLAADAQKHVADNGAEGIYADNVRVEVPGPERIKVVEVPVSDPGTLDKAEAVEQLAAERRDERLTLAALWDVTHGRMDLYHQIVTGQARRSFGAAQVAMIIGFVMLIGFAVLAAEAKTTTAAISAGSLGAVGAAFAAYIGRTFIRSQESAASHLRAYFDQPLELSRYLAAERLLADAKALTPEQHAAIVTSLVQSIATGGQPGGKAKPIGRQPRGRASRESG